MPHELTGSDGSVQWCASHQAWGMVLDCRDVAKVDPLHGNVALVHQPLRFQGQYFDHQTGLHYNHQRYYDPHVGRFVTQDPIGLSGGANPYRYAPNPGKWIDPLGLAVDLSLVGSHYACGLDIFPNTF